MAHLSIGHDCSSGLVQHLILDSGCKKQQKNSTTQHKSWLSSLSEFLCACPDAQVAAAARQRQQKIKQSRTTYYFLLERLPRPLWEFNKSDDCQREPRELRPFCIWQCNKKDVTITIFLHISLCGKCRPSSRAALWAFVVGTRNTRQSITFCMHFRYEAFDSFSTLFTYRISKLVCFSSFLCAVAFPLLHRPFMLPIVQQFHY